LVIKGISKKDFPLIQNQNNKNNNKNNINQIYNQNNQNNQIKKQNQLSLDNENYIYHDFESSNVINIYPDFNSNNNNAINNTNIYPELEN
jgi:hypothetical protein